MGSAAVGAAASAPSSAASWLGRSGAVSASNTPAVAAAGDGAASCADSVGTAVISGAVRDSCSGRTAFSQAQASATPATGGAAAGATLGWRLVAPSAMSCW